MGRRLGGASLSLPPPQDSSTPLPAQRHTGSFAHAERTALEIAAEQMRKWESFSEEEKQVISLATRRNKNTFIHTLAFITHSRAQHKHPKHTQHIFTYMLNFYTYATL